jgi:hypothetical protein
MLLASVPSTWLLRSVWHVWVILNSLYSAKIVIESSAGPFIVYSKLSIPLTDHTVYLTTFFSCALTDIGVKRETSSKPCQAELNLSRIRGTCME